MITVRRATVADKGFMREVYNHPEVYPMISDDGCPDADLIDYGPVLSSPAVYVLILSDGDEDMGLLLFVPWNSITFELHTAILPQYRGVRAIEGIRMAGDWIFQNTACRKVVTQVPETNIKAAFLARKCGMVQEGINRKSFLKHGIMHDQYLFGICREEARCQ